MQDEHTLIGKIMAYYPVMDHLTEEEKQFFEEWLAKEANRKFFDAAVNNETRLADLKTFLEGEASQEANREKYYTAILKLKKPTLTWWKKWPTYMAAASVLITLSVIGYKWFTGKQKGFKHERPAMVQLHDVKPGQFKARLTLGDGSVVVLDSISNGRVVQQGSTAVYNKNGQLVYQRQGKQQAEVLYNTLTTDKGQIYATVLSDGTKIWLNSQSSLRYPVTFDDHLRKVEITGEAYFEVAASRERPFIVNVNGMEVKVMGTHFNISSYADEADIKTTLLKGKVQVTKGSAVTELAPGQQAQWNKQTEKITKKEEVDVDEVVAWRYGYFSFSDADLQTVLRQLVRWYDVEVSYKGKVANMTFQGKIPRNSNLSNVLKILETNEVHFTIDGKKIIVSP
jgi:ferric-dicitrate binding protein FerR (iron transport regulator)